MAVRAQFILTTGVSGSGKTYRRCAHFLVNDFLPNHTGVHISNFPINMDALEAYCIKNNICKNVRERVRIIPEDVIKTWLSGESGPWDFFTEGDLSGCHLALDEAHNFCSKKSKPYHRERWGRWLGELRHLGMTAEFLTQAEGNMANEIMNQCEIRLEIINGENRIDPVMHMRMSDWYELKAKITGKYIAPSFELEYMQMMGKWKVMQERKFFREPEIFELYDSFSKPVAGNASGHSELRHYERMSWPRFLLWFFGSNASTWFRLFVIIGLMSWLMFFGGVKQCFKWLLSSKIYDTNYVLEKTKKVANKTQNQPGVPAGASGDFVPNFDSNLQNTGEYVNLDENGSQSVNNVQIPRRVVCVTDRFVLCNDGRVYRVGETIADVQILAFDVRRRRVMMSDYNIYEINELLYW